MVSWVTTMLKPNILIASSGFDRQLIEPVIRDLSCRGYDLIVYEGDAVAHSVDSLTIHISSANELKISYKGASFSPNSVVAAWYRRPTLFFSTVWEDPARYESLAKEYSDVQDFIWSLVRDKAWFNHPNAMRFANRKLRQLIMARSVGFNIPETLVTNDWSDVMEILSKEVTLKSVNGIFSSKDGTRLLYSQRLKNHPDSLPLQTSPYPGIWQPHLLKKREWRITVVGDEIFDAAIYTTDEAKNDWREHQDNDTAVQFRAEPFPEEERARCREYLRRYGLRFGAFDFIESPDGKITFLELNPNGQYGWLEEKLSLPISAAITAELDNLAKRNRV
jgi:hypothetical protein